MDYDDQFPTCLKTYATLRIFSNDIPAEEISTSLGVTPSTCFNKGEGFGSRGLKRKLNGWFLTTEGILESKDCRRHLDWVLASIESKKDKFIELREKLVEVDITCFWLSGGQGGPIISSLQMKQLGALEIDIWWDVYFDQPKP